MEQIRQEDEHQPRAALIQLRACGCHGRNDDQCRKACRQGIKEGNARRRGRNIFFIGEIGAIDDGAVACDGEGEECLSEGVNPCHRAFQCDRVYAKDVAIACHCTGL